MNPQMYVPPERALQILEQKKWLTSYAPAYSTNLIIILVMMQASKKVPFEDPMTLNLVRALYVVSNLIIAGVYLYTKMQIDKKRGTLLPPTTPTHSEMRQLADKFL